MCLRGTEDTRAITERTRQMVNYELTWTWETSGGCSLREALHTVLGFLASGSSGAEIQERAPHGFSGGRNNNHWGVILRAFSITKAHSPEGNAWPEFCLHPALTFLSWKRSKEEGAIYSSRMLSWSQVRDTRPVKGWSWIIWSENMSGTLCLSTTQTRPQYNTSSWKVQTLCENF